MTEKYYNLVSDFKLGYVTIEQLKEYVLLNNIDNNLGITKDEFKEITGVDFD